jgi:hypothetical protein
MSDLNSAQLDPIDGPVRRRLASELDGQLGRAEAAFLRHVGMAQARVPSAAATATRPPRPAARPASHGRFMRFGGWTLSFVGTALAASIAALWAAPALFRDAGSGSGRPLDQQHPLAVQQPMIHYVQDRTWDGGTIVVNDDEDGVPHPARRYVRERIERTRWYDPEQKAWAETTVPQQDEAIVPVDTY